MKNQYLLSIVEVSRQYNLPRDRLYSESRRSDTEIPFIKIANTKKIHIPLLEELLREKAEKHEELFK